jgi:type II secretory pathway pseudopilin PulG
VREIAALETFWHPNCLSFIVRKVCDPVERLHLKGEITMKREMMNHGGFTIIEALVVVAVLGLAVLAGLPALNKFMHRSKLEGVSRQTAMLIHRARQEAIKQGVPVVVKPDFGSREVLVFTDVDDDGVFTPDSAQPLYTADYELARVPLPSRIIYFMGTSGVPATPGNAEDSVLGLAVSNDAVVVEPDGSVRDTGAIRLADNRGNYLEVAVTSKAGGKVEVRKFNFAPPGGLEPGYYPKAMINGDPTWVWHWEFLTYADGEIGTGGDPPPPAS